MYQFPSFALTWLYIHQGVARHYSDWVAPFGNPRISGCVRLPEA